MLMCFAPPAVADLHAYSVAAYLLKGVTQLQNEIVGCLALGLVQHIVQQRLSHSQPKLTAMSTACH